MRRALLFVIVGVVIGAAVANELRPRTVSAVTPPTVVTGVEHLERAEKRLRSAGLAAPPDQTNGTPRAGNAETLKQLAHKRAALQVLEREVSELERQVESFGRVQLQLRYVEVDLGAFQALGAYKSWFDGFSVVNLNADAMAKLNQDFELLEVNQHAKVMCEPTIVTHNGCPATCACGTQIQVPKATPEGVEFEYRTVGMRLDVLPELVGVDRAKIKLAYQHTAVDPVGVVMVGDQIAPILSGCEATTTCETPLGSTIACVVPVAQGPMIGARAAVYKTARAAERLVQTAGWDTFEMPLPDSVTPHKCGILLITPQKVSSPQ